jgi:DNA-binding MarR family transcriptional regulator
MVDEEYEPSVAHLPWEVKRAEREAARTIDKVLRGTGLTKSQFGVLQALAHMRVASSAELARTVFVTPQAMVGMIAALEQKGYIERNPAAESARIIEARLTTSGRAALKRSQEALARIDERLRTAFNPDEAVRFSGFLGRFIESLDRIDDANWEPSRRRRRAG